MTRWLKILLRLVGGVFFLILLLWMGIVIYVNTHKKELLTSITSQLNENINGKLTVESMEPTLVRGFPAVSVSLSNVLLRDTMYHVHHHNLLEAKEISITVNAFSILKGAPRIRDIRIKDGNVYLFTDSLGYSNTNLFIQKEVRDSTGKKPPPKLNHVYFDNVHFVFENKTQKKLFNFEIDHLEGRLDYYDAGWKGSINVKMLVRSLDFYNPNGPFLKDKHVDADLTANYNSKKQLLDIPFKEIEVEGDDVSIGATVYLAQDPVRFKIEIKADNIGYQAGRSMLSTHIQEKIGIVNLKERVNVQATIKGSVKRRDQPLVYVRWQVKDNILEGQGTSIKDCSFTGYFYNQVDPAIRVCDENSVIALDHFTGTWEEIDFRADSVRISNLISPVLGGHFISNFELSKLNPVLNNNTFRLDKGNVDLNLVFRGGIKNNDSTQPSIVGDVKLKGAAVTYMPRKLVFTNTAGELNFRGSDLFVKNVKLQNGPNVLFMDGNMRNLLNLYYTAPDKVLLDWHIRSPNINLDQYKNFLEARNKITVTTAVAKPSKANSVSRFSSQLDQVLERSSVQLRMEVGKLGYQKFTATDILAAVKLTQESIVLDNVSVKHAGGRVALNGLINQNGSVNHFDLNAKVDGVRVNEFLAAFGNFGQTTVTEKNIKGELFVQATVTGAITDKGTLVPSSMNGTANFELMNSALMEFTPLKNIGKFVFRRRNFSYINITSLKDKLDINGDKIRIYPLKLSSDAINADVEGIYSFGAGTDINVDIPLRNPKNDELILDDSVKLKKRMKGIVIHLNVADDKEGKMRIRLVGKAAPQDKNADPDVYKKRKRRGFLGL